MRRRVVLGLTMSAVVCALVAAPAAAATPTSVPPAQPSLAPSGHEAAKALRTLVAPITLLVMVSLVGEEIDRARRGKRKRASTRNRPKRRRRSSSLARVDRGVRERAPLARAVARPVAPPQNANDPTTGDSYRRTGPSAQQVRTDDAPPLNGQMSARRPGENVAKRIAELDAERANWVRGERGEKVVGTELDGLKASEWRVFHSIPRGRSGTDLDHLVIGPAGIYTINTKNVSANVWVAARVLMVGGTRTGYLPAAVREANDVARRLRRNGSDPIDVRPVLVFLRPITIKAAPADVTVIEVSALRPWLERQVPVLTPTRAYELARIADDPATWA